MRNRAAETMQQPFLEVLIEFDAGDGVQALPALALPCTIGSGVRDAVRIRHASVAAAHAHLWSPEPGVLAIAPAAGPVIHTNGPLNRPCEAKDGAWFYVGQVPIRVRVSAKARSTALEKRSSERAEATRSPVPAQRTPPAVVMFGMLLILAAAAAASVPVYLLYTKHLKASTAAAQPSTADEVAPMGDGPADISPRTTQTLAAALSLPYTNLPTTSSSGASPEQEPTACSREPDDWEFESPAAKDASSALKRMTDAGARGDVGGWLATLEEYATLLGDYKERKLDGSSSATEDVEMAIVVSKEWLQMVKSLDESPMKDAIQRRGKPERFVLQFADIMKRHGLME